MHTPNLTTALTWPIQGLERRILSAQTDIEHWLRSEWLKHHPPFYGSVDLRNSGFKLAPIDMNMFPGGFNNLNESFQPLCIQAAMTGLDKVCPTAKRILLIPENHTRNTFYLQNVFRIKKILQQAGTTVRLGTLNPEITKPTALTLPDGKNLLLEPLVRRGNRVGLADYDPCAILLNNDLSTGIPEILQHIEQTVMPPLQAGWSTRRKTAHFAAYDHVAKAFSHLIGIDPWLINPYFDGVSDLHFQDHVGEEQLADSISQILEKTRQKYQEYQIQEKPFVVVKANAGTYGMGVMTVKDPADVIGLNRKQRNKMSVIKEGLEVSDVIVQEGVYTFETMDSAVAEPVIYMIDHYVVGGFYRIHTARSIDENLNAPGMQFVPLQFNASCSLPDDTIAPDSPTNRFYSYGVVARLALLAGAIEIENIRNESQ